MCSSSNRNYNVPLPIWPIGVGFARYCVISPPIVFSSHMHLTRSRCFFVDVPQSGAPNKKRFVHLPAECGIKWALLIFQMKPKVTKSTSELSENDRHAMNFSLVSVFVYSIFHRQNAIARRKEWIVLFIVEVRRLKHKTQDHRRLYSITLFALSLAPCSSSMQRFQFDAQQNDEWNHFRATQLVRLDSCTFQCAKPY